MGLSFLNKKSWHTASFQNIEKVWLAEQKVKEQRRREQERQKKLKEERQIEDLKKVQVEAGLIPKSHLERMDWMYTFSNAKTNTKEDFFANATKEHEEEKQQKDGYKKKIIPCVKDSTVNEEYEKFVRFHEDPLVAIMKEEQNARMAVADNPLKLKEIREEIERLKEGKKKKHIHKKHHHNEKKKRKNSKDSKEEEKSDSEKERHNRHKKHSKRHDSESRSRSRSISRDRKNSSDDSESEHYNRKSKHSHHRRSESRSKSPDRTPSRSSSKELGPPSEMMAKFSEIQEQEALRKKQNIDYKHLTEEEKEQKRKEMQEAAFRDKEYALKVTKNEAINPTEVKKSQTNPEFIKNMRADVYTKGEMSLEEKIKRNKHYTQSLRQIKDRDEE